MARIRVLSHLLFLNCVKVGSSIRAEGSLRKKYSEDNKTDAVLLRKGGVKHLSR